MTPTATLRSLGVAVLDVLYPPRCAACAAPRRPAETFCAACQATLLAAPGGVDGCAMPAAAASTLTLQAASFLHGGALATAIHRAKYEQRFEVAAALAELLAAVTPSLAPLPDVLVPVPLHPRRLRQRGFNLATVLARALARRVGRPLAARLLHRVRATPPQVGRDRAARLANVRDAFQVSRPVPSCVWLVDDVRTTGATAEECARVLCREGARDVCLITLSRAP